MVEIPTIQRKIQNHFQKDLNVHLFNWVDKNNQIF